ncbi:MAG: hypothetical protein AB8F94_05140 [Saprospiraceae bacterium]
MEKEIIRFVKNIFKFSVIALAFYVLAICLSGDFIPSKWTKNLIYNSGGAGHSLNRFEEVENVENVDIIFLGSSHTYRGFDNRIFNNNGFTNFNLGSSAQTSIQTEILLDRYLNQLNPTIAIYEVYPITFTLDGIESAMDLVSNDQNDFASLKMAMHYQHIKLYNSLIYSTYRQFFFFYYNTLQNINSGNDRYISGGFVEKTKSKFVPKPFEKQELIFFFILLNIFQNNIKTLEKNGAKVYLVQAPITTDYYQSFSNTSEFDSLMNNFGTYYDFNKKVKLIDSLHFFDAHHLNQKGVEIFNKKLIEIIL